MHIISYPVFLMAGINLSTAIYHLTQYLLRKKYKFNLVFSFVCFTVFLYDLFCIGLYNSQSIKEGVFWQQLQFKTIPAMAFSMVLFLAMYTNNTKNKIIRFSLFMLTAVFIVNFLPLPDQMFLLKRAAVKHIDLINLLQITYYECEVGPLFIFTLIVAVVTYLYLYILLLKHLKTSVDKIAIVMLISQSIYLLTNFNDSLVANQVYEFIYLAEYSLFLVVCSMSYVLINDFVKVHNSIETLNMKLNMLVKGMHQIIESFYDIFKVKDHNIFLNKILEQAASMIDSSKAQINSISDGLIISGTDHNAKVIYGVGRYKYFVGTSIGEVLSENEILNFQEAVRTNSIKYANGCFVAPFHNTLKQQYSILFNYADHLSEWEIDILKIYFSNTSVASENLLLNKEIIDTQREIIYTLGEVVEIRSNETGHHVKRVAEYSKILANELGMDDNEVELIHTASSMHDIGKLGIPDSILNKPGKLTNEEFEIMKQHCQIGYDMLKKSDREILKAAAIIALQHHEKYNGTGYPSGLNGINIHIYGRITALADVFDALGSDRVYKKAWEMDEILKFIRLEKGKHFDPVLVEIFFNNLRKFLEIKEKYSDSKAFKEQEDRSCIPT